MTPAEMLAQGMDWIAEACKPEAKEEDTSDHDLRGHSSVTGEVQN